MRKLRRIIVKSRKAIALDTRALSLFRIAIALLLLTDLAIRCGDLEAFYSDNGAVPRSLVYNTNWNPLYFPFHMFGGSVAYEAALFVLAAVCAGALLVGWRTKLFTVLSWILLVSLHNRNPWILQGGDELLRNALFWAIFLPLGQHYSYDAKRKGPFPPKMESGLATTGYVLLVFSVYFFSALQKHSAEWETEGTAVYYALSLDQIALPAGKLIYHYPGLLKVLTHFTWITELVAGFFFFFYWKNYRLRLVGIALLVLLHAGISMTLYVGLFFLIGLATLLPLLPPFVMDRFDRLSRRSRTTLNIPAQPRKKIFALNYPRQVFLGATVLLCLVWNISNLPYSGFSIRATARYFAAIIRIDQNWGMFAPSVFKDDGWYIYEGYLADGTVMDLNRDGAPVIYEKPASVVALFKNDRWRKYSENLLFSTNSHLRPSFCIYTRSNWNLQHPAEQIKVLKIVYMKEFSLPDYQVSQPVREVLSECQ